jgi:hypothetical protein
MPRDPIAALPLSTGPATRGTVANMSADAVPAVRIAPGVFLLQAERVRPGDVFDVDGERFEVGSELVPVGTGVYLTQVLTSDGRTLGVQLHVGRKVN